MAAPGVRRRPGRRAPKLTVGPVTLARALRADFSGNFRTITLDWRGTGRSGKPGDDTYSTRGFAADHPEVEGAYTIADRHKMTLGSNHFALPPNGTWHAHGVAGEGVPVAPFEPGHEPGHAPAAPPPGAAGAPQLPQRSVPDGPRSRHPDRDEQAGPEQHADPEPGHELRPVEVAAGGRDRDR